MKIKKNWIIILILIILLLLIISSIILNQTDNFTISDNIIIALIGSLTTIITIIGSIYVNQMLINENSRQQRLLEIRKIKQEYYHKFTEAFLLRLTYLRNMKSKEFKESDLKFCLEKNRLPLYASQELIEYVEEIASGKSQKADFKTLYKMIRLDLNKEGLKNFKNLQNLSVTLPTEQTRKGS